jgi:Cytidylate kinase-like family
MEQRESSGDANRFRVITISREYAAGGESLGERLAARLNWQLLDRELVEQVAAAAHVEPELVTRFDERCDSWLHSLTKRVFSYGAIEGVNEPPDVLDAESLAGRSRRVIEQAASLGDCVIVGRGAQCALAGRPDALHVFVFAPAEERLRRAHERGHRCDLGGLAAVDRNRSEFMRTMYGRDWRDPRLYHLMLNSTLGIDALADLVIQSLRRG